MKPLTSAQNSDCSDPRSDVTISIRKKQNRRNTYITTILSLAGTIKSDRSDPWSEDITSQQNAKLLKHTHTRINHTNTLKAKESVSAFVEMTKYLRLQFGYVRLHFSHCQPPSDTSVTCSNDLPKTQSTGWTTTEYRLYYR